jgi:bis(5'-nucleosyl)-tetraphosphatase (symmetrical)
MVDRGPDSCGVVRFARENKFESVCGNHDNKFVRYRNHELKRLASLTGPKPYKNPMRFNEDKHRTYNGLNEEDHIWLASLPDSILVDGLELFVVHAGVMPGRDPRNQPGNVYRHCRYVFDKDFSLANLNTTTYAKPEGSTFWADLYNENLNIIHGHHVIDMAEPKVMVNKAGYRVFGIDTGCVFGGRLTAAVFDGHGQYEFVQVQAQKIYYDR